MPNNRPALSRSAVRRALITVAIFVLPAAVIAVVDVAVSIALCIETAVVAPLGAALSIVVTFAVLDRRSGTERAR